MEKSMTYRVMSNSIAFVIGFSIIFIFVIGSLGGVITETLDDHADLINKILGAIIIILGIHMLGIFKIKALMMEKRFNLGNKKPGLFGSMIVGMAFSFGWVPCTGPILAAIFALTQDSGNWMLSFALMTVYSLGLAIPFLLTALALNVFLSWFQKFKHHLHKVEIVSGILVIGIGVLIIMGGLTNLNQYFASTGIGSVGSGLEGSLYSSEAKIGFLFAFVGGLISFLSPCVLPLIPMYLSYLSGASIGELTGEIKAEPAGEAV